MITCKIVAYLFSLAVGYWVLALADKEKNLTKKIGKWIGWIIIVVSVCGMLCATAFCMKCCGGGKCNMTKWGCPMGSKGMMDCPGKMGEMGKMRHQGMRDDSNRMEDQGMTEEKKQTE
jgi:hypothetical protein